MNLYALIGFPLGHSFSKRYFTEKFQREGLAETHVYELFELPEANELPALVAQWPELKGLNVTIPHKKAVLPFLTELDPLAERIGAVNVIKVQSDGTLKGYNSDYWGFRWSLERWEPFQQLQPKKALILGDGGATKAVRIALEDLGITYKTVSRKESDAFLNYSDLNADVLAEYSLLINATPLGTYPNVDACPDLPYASLTEQNLLYDLVYNPEETLFMKRGAEHGAATHNGYRMLELQAEKSWEIWNE
ncbi:shikimate dehydrogenase [Siphonobacter sp. BAB-5385]|uniref:shikimate dehydrogenase family protein n=1 Tax=unclassified Siphonobacter TaxID=2635712 RepID=UPI000B9EAA02|nr:MULTISPECIES: shikimate dehydrogenase [unclassified Siphonobacter]OZI07079.1 shikimate dehydrogenase [Siphonobacter sp. BAB-5385]PMD96727.1 shikimate dehydrogenase [Siphonobacter sp. BAB-5405]